MGSGINQAHDPGSLKVFPLGIPLDFTFEEVKYCCTYLWLASNEIRWEDKKLFVWLGEHEVEMAIKKSGNLL